MTEKYNLVRLSSTRELAMDRPAIEYKKATLYGYIRYSTTIEGMVVAAAKYRGTQRDYADDLPGTKKEIAAIDTILKEQQLQVQIFTSSEANEESVKALSGSKQNILHFATHGFYWQDSTGIDPMERCGLLFAGANNVLIGSPERLKDVEVNDGILTAKELSVLDFRNADIVVMSACETGLGEINGEGVFGLQRAFKMAGAKTIMMSLWQVSDDATRLLMTSFYRNLSQGMSKREAFRSAQQEVRNYTTDGTSSEERGISGKEKKLNKGKMGGGNQPAEVSKQPAEGSQQKAEVSKPYASPYYWAGFILLD
jgi:CHAT domain-containing protein